MEVQSSISVAEYLSTSYRPDCDYLEGEVVERNLGEQGHGWLQALILTWLMVRRTELGIRPLPETRLQIRSDRFRIPDVMVLRAGDPNDGIVRVAPLLCIEILSPEDRMSRIMVRLEDYFSIGVPVCWILDPETKAAWIARPDAQGPVRDGFLKAGAIELPLNEIWPD